MSCNHPINANGSYGVSGSLLLTNRATAWLLTADLTFVHVSVLPGCKGLVAVRVLFLRSSGLFCRLLWHDDLQDAAARERESEDGAERAS